MRLIYKNLFFIFFLFVIDIYGQGTFELIFESTYEERIGDIAEDFEGNFFGVGVQIRYSPYRQYPVIWKINFEGDTISKVYYSNDSLTAFQYIIPNFDGTLDVFGYRNSYGNYDVLFYKLNSDLSVIKSEIVYLPQYSSVLVTELLYTSDYYFLVGKLNIPDSTQKPGIIKLNKNLVFISFDYSTYGSITEAFFSADSSQIWMYTNDFTPTEATSPTNLFIIDTTFNIISLKPFPANQFSSFSYFEDYLSGGLVDNDKILICGNFIHGTNFPFNTEHDIGTVICDTLMNQYSFDIIGTVDTVDQAGAFNSSDYNTTDSIFICGTLKVGDGFLPNHPTFIILRLIDNDLNTLFERTFGGDAFYYTTNIIATSDGGCLIGAHRSELGSEWRRNTYLLKLNKEGLLTSTNIISSSELKPYKFYVNYESKQIEIKLALPEATACLYKLDGSLLNTLSLKEGFNTIPIIENKSLLILLIKTPTKLFTEKI